MLKERMSQHLNYLQATISDLKATNYPSGEGNKLLPQLSLPCFPGSNSCVFNLEARNKNALFVAAIEYFRPNIHLGWLASGDRIMRSAESRDQIATQEGVIGFEWAGVGAWRQLPTVVITGVGNYGDGYGTDPWPAYASASAASCAKAMLEVYNTL